MRSSLLALLVACSSHAGEPKKPNGSNAPPVDGVVAAVPGPSEKECGDLFAHEVELHLAEVRQTKPKQVPTADELAKLQTELRDQYLTECRTTTLERYRCAMAATTLADLGACQPTPSSSTSNSSVAPGGMTPAAPLSP